MTNGYNTPIGVPIGLPSILSLGLPPLVNPYPTLNLDFIQNPQFDSRITFSRGSQATLFDSTGTLRYAKQNLLLQSQALTTSPWITTSLSAVGSKIAPDGTATAIAITATGANGRTRQPVTVVAGQTYTHSMFVRRVTGSGNVTLAILDSGGTALFSTVLSLTSEWQRFTVSGAPAVTSILAGIIIATSTDAIEVWGAQLNITNMEGGVTSSLTTYYPTTTAAYYAPRFDYDPSTLQPRGLLIEEQRTNLLTRSIPDAAVPTGWSVGFSTGTFSHTLVAATTPYAGLQQFIKNDQTVSGRSFLLLNLTLSANTTYTLTVIVNKATSSITSGDTTVASINNFSDATGTLSISFSSVPDSGIARLTFTTGTDTTGEVRIGCGCSFNTVASLTFGAWQLEAGAFATSYIPTTTTALTRNADVASMTGTNFSSWYNQSEGTLFASALPRSTAATLPRFYEFNGASTAISIRTVGIGGSIAFEVQDTTTQASFATGTWSSTAFMRVAGAYKVNDFAGSQDGGAVVTDNSGTVPTVTALYIGNRSDGARNLNGWIARFAYYPTRLPNATLQALTA